MPTPCPRCGKIIELDDMVSHPNEFKTLVCEACHDQIEEENNRGFETDSFGNVVEWSACPDDCLINFSVNSVSVADWSYEDEPEFVLNCFMKIWNKAQSLTNNANIEVLTAERDQFAAQCNQLRAQLEYFIGNNFVFNEGSEYIAEDIEDLLSKTPEICLSYIRDNAIRSFAKETADGFSVPFVLDFAEDFIRNQAVKDAD